MTANDQIDMMNRMMAMQRAGHPMFEIRPPTLKLTPPPPDSWKSMASGAGT
jgi:hypothetical protein